MALPHDDHRAVTPTVRSLAQVLSNSPAVRFSEALAPVSEALAPVTRFSEALAPVMRLGELLAPLNIQPRLGPPVPSLFGEPSCDRPQTETRPVWVSGTREDWAKSDDGHMVGFTKC